MAETAENEQMKTMREFMMNYNKLSEVCFADCVWDFTTRKISGLENQCSLYCAEKYLKMNQRVSTRFQVVSGLAFIWFSPSFLPGVPDAVQRERDGRGEEVRPAVIWASLVNVESCDVLCV